MEMTVMGKIYPTILNGIMKEQLESMYDETEIQRIESAARKDYEAIVARTPLLGGSKNWMINNMYLGTFFIALYRQINDKVSMEQYRQVITISMERSDLAKKMVTRGDVFSEAQQQRYAELSKWAEQNKEAYPWNWQFTISPEPNHDCVYLTFTNCALCRLCEAEGLPELTPLLCESDFVMADMMGCTLTRTKTLAEGADCCDFCFHH
jgi:hypothetical protein